ncbi:carboxy-S-adenosyl-L-methionine synthase CmoA [Methylomonas sp. CM2]|uniref:carboxy-S-adenosyl-L-methionine synthase CmoA n=1 Tax=Methylomonas sp. CM2 TaxID=3417647 RepID=UPI003CEA36B1
MPASKDSLYASPLGEIAAFSFDENVVKVFPDMIRRSVPGYGTMISAIGLLAGRYARENSRCYDLGCSLGAAALAMRANIAVRNCKIVAVDCSEAMIEQCRRDIELAPAEVDIEWRCADIRDIEIRDASVVVLNFTLQFIPLEDRGRLIAGLYDGLLPGGVLILSEKLAFDDKRQQDLQTEMHHLFKKAQGYSELEISQKRTALENVLIPETFSEHRARLEAAGFSSVEVWFQYFNFASMIALK